MPSKDPAQNLHHHNHHGNGMTVTRSGMCGRLQRLIQGWMYELFVGVIVILNLCCMFAEFQWKGYDSAQRVGLRDDNQNWAAASRGFAWADMAFSVYYLLDLGARVLLLPLSYFREPANACDTCIVIFCSAETFILPITGNSDNMGYVKLLRLIRVLRITKIVSFMRQFAELRVLVQVLVVARHSLFWGMMVMAMILGSCGIFLASLGQSFVEDAENDPDMVAWVYQHFGHSSTAAWTLFEAAFTGTWPRFARKTMDEWNSTFAVFWALYVIVVNFTVVRVIQGMFLKQTMAVASADAEMVALQVMKERDRYAHKIRTVFELVDKDKNGTISNDEFEALLANEEVENLFWDIGLEMDEVELLYTVLSDDNGTADYVEFLDGALRMKSNARTIDAVFIQHIQRKANRMLEDLCSDLGQIMNRTGLEQSRRSPFRVN